ncbi:regulator of chromosome condensation 1/beta-lactamase-inhibitor protein II, partial [Baffinella frigidus]
VAQVAVGDYHTLTLSPGGCVSGFGSNARGQLVHRASPVTAVDLDGGIVKVAAGGYHSLALSWEGDLLAWGDNSSAQLGKPANEFDDEALVLDQGYPLQVHQPIFVAGAETSNGGGVQDMAAGFLHNLALLRDGRLLGWGNNVFGQLGNGKNFSFYFGPEYTENEHNEYTGEAAPMRVRLPGARPPALSALAAG